MQRIRNSQHHGATRGANFGFESCTSKLLFLVWFSNLKFLPRACHQCDRKFKFTTLVAGKLAIMRACCAIAVTALSCLAGGSAEAATPGTDADAAAIEACLAEPAMAGRDPRECGESLYRSCVSEAGAVAEQKGGALACEKRRGDAWNIIARQTYRRIEAKLSDNDKRLLRTSQVQFELELSDLCSTARALGGDDPDLAAAVCSSELVTARALILKRIAGERGAATP